MSHRIFALKAFTLLASAALIFGCGGGGGDGNSGSQDNSGEIATGGDSSGLATTCGVINDGERLSPINPDRGEQVTLASVEDSNALVLGTPSGQIRVKLQGIGATTGFDNTAAKKLFQNLSGEPLYFFSTGCTATLASGQVGTVGQVVTASGKSFTEEVISAKAAGIIETTGTCGESALAACYTALKDSHHLNSSGAPHECSATVPANVRYRPADTDCGGNASIVLTGDLTDAFSIQLRYPDGSDRLDPDCSTNGCTPYKVQDYINVSGIKVGCFGAPGNAVVMDDVQHVSIKRDANDHDPLRYCIPNPEAPIN